MESAEDPHFGLGRLASLACVLEVSAAKPGNVHRGADFEDLTFNDFLVSSQIIGHVIESNLDSRVGSVVRQVVEQTRRLVGTNTNLGIALLICPLAKCGHEFSPASISSENLQRVLDELDSQDCADVYSAINCANPSGMSKVNEMDVVAPPPRCLLDAMRAAESRDLIARQYANGFVDVFESAVPFLVSGRERFGTISEAIVFAHVSMMARFGDSLIARKCGEETARHVKFLANKTINTLESEPDHFWREVGELDFWLRSDGHRRNPGTTADMIAAGLFVGLCQNTIQPPFH